MVSGMLCPGIQPCGYFTSAGGMICGWLVGKIAGSVSFRLAMYIPWISLVIVFLIVWKKFPRDESRADSKEDVKAS